ncbi:endonuclease/exonuclease/phosphatase family protein [Flammeovirga sp. SubArs3]|uniref:endonuclease/exonuclease/phosphatase family protein n=1 Tax=Flammeovirga sp. SubArs3 TaxID=2995316 RepID=UPI00248ACF51|nr:endonuclease/exonuclease/phosphatase family protein [Flammeovirga sp. SubArs3]
MSYNVSVFNTYKYLNHDYKESKELIQWLEKDQTDIYCFQEYYNSDSITKKENSLFQTNKRLGKDKGYYSYTPPFLTNHIKATFGLGIFSKYPIIHQAAIPFKEIGGSETNGIIYCDIKVDSQKVIRVFNCHFQSIVLDNGENQYTSILDKGIKTLKKIYLGTLLREQQFNLLYQNILNSPYPVIVCGDFNEPPSAYGYSLINKKLTNSFNNAGQGLGYTLRDLPFRIDQVFHSTSQLKSIDFKVFSENKLSDHYPIRTRITYE